MKEDGYPEPNMVAESIGHLLHPLDVGVLRFKHGVRYRGSDGVQHPSEVRRNILPTFFTATTRQ